VNVFSVKESENHFVYREWDTFFFAKDKKYQNTMKGIRNKMFFIFFYSSFFSGSIPNGMIFFTSKANNGIGFIY